jgi:hypothetical protein
VSERPSAKQRDERLKLDLTPNQLVEGLLNAAPHPEPVTKPRKKSAKDKAPARKKK